MDKKQSYAMCLAEKLQDAYNATYRIKAVAELRRQHTEIETMRTGYNAARLEIESLRGRAQMLGQLEATAANGEATNYPPLVCDYCNALTPDPWHSSGMLHGKMSKHIHSCDACAARGAAQAAPVDADAQRDAERYRWLREYAIGAYITAQGKGSTAIYLLTKAPALDGIGEETDTAIDAAIALAAPAQAAAPFKTLEEAIAHAKEVAEMRLSLRDGARKTGGMAHRSATFARPLAAREVDQAVQQDAERWQFFAEYLVSTRTDLDDEIVGCDSVQKMARVLDAARAAQKEAND